MLGVVEVESGGDVSVIDHPAADDVTRIQLLERRLAALEEAARQGLGAEQEVVTSSLLPTSSSSRPRMTKRLVPVTMANEHPQPGTTGVTNRINASYQPTFLTHLVNTLYQSINLRYQLTLSPHPLIRALVPETDDDIRSCTT